MANPESIQWNDAMLTGVVEIDTQHRILVDTLIEAKTKLTGDASDPLFDQISRDLLAYAIYHFDTEESLMRKHGYAAVAPGEAATHLHQHRHFSETVVALREDARANRPGARDAMLAFLQDWLINHIMTTDKRLGEFICTSAPAKSA
jgi:hemerythrin-like metal-binding protein